MNEMLILSDTVYKGARVAAGDVITCGALKGKNSDRDAAYLVGLKKAEVDRTKFDDAKKEIARAKRRRTMRHKALQDRAVGAAAGVIADLQKQVADLKALVEGDIIDSDDDVTDPAA